VKNVPARIFGISYHCRHTLCSDTRNQIKKRLQAEIDARYDNGKSKHYDENDARALDYLGESGPGYPFKLRKSFLDSSARSYEKIGLISVIRFLISHNYQFPLIICFLYVRCAFCRKGNTWKK